MDEESGKMMKIERTGEKMDWHKVMETQ